MDGAELARCFTLLSRRMQLFVSTACEEMGISYGEYALLSELFAREGVSQDALAGRLAMDKAVVARIVKRLEEMGLIRREKDSEDSRIRRVYLTEEAGKREGFLGNVMRTWTDCLTRGIPPEERPLIERGIKAMASQAEEASIQALARVAGKRRDHGIK